MAKPKEPTYRELLTSRFGTAQTKLVRPFFHKRAFDAGYAELAQELLTDFVDGYDELERLLQELRATRDGIASHLKSCGRSK